MKLVGRISYDELKLLVTELKEILPGQFLKNIYHYKKYWLFKFSKISLIFEYGTNLWIGEFPQREDEIHSVCRKMRVEVKESKVLNINIIDNDRTVIIDFRDYKIIFELFAKGNLILTDNEYKIIVLTRIYQDITHKQIYEIKKFCDFNINTENTANTENIGWKVINQEIQINSNTKDFENLILAISTLWNIKLKSLFIEKKKIKEDTSLEKQLKSQILEFDKNIELLENEIILADNNYDIINKLYDKLKKIKYKRNKALEHLEKSNVKILPKKVIQYNKLITSNWYQTYYWWYTKNNILVVGGKNADQNEKLVKDYMGINDLYFHADFPGSGSFIMFIKDTKPTDIDLYDTATGVISLTQLWKNGVGGNVFYVNSSQVSKTAPSGEFITKGSFMISGKKNFIKIDILSLGYGIYNNMLMLAPYNIINRLPLPIIKLTPKTDSNKNCQKIINKKLKEVFSLKTLHESIYIFSMTSNIFVKK